MTRVKRVKLNIKAIHLDVFKSFGKKINSIYSSISCPMIPDGFGINQRSPILNHPPHSKMFPNELGHMVVFLLIRPVPYFNLSIACFVGSQKVQVCRGAIPTNWGNKISPQD